MAGRHCFVIRLGGFLSFFESFVELPVDSHITGSAHVNFIGDAEAFPQLSDC